MLRPVVVFLCFLAETRFSVVQSGRINKYGMDVRVKRSDIDLQTCIDNFDIHKDKIIRTQDSRAMGAKYLNEIDLDSREECLRLCCETENCDVFVYEEKNSGSCYLFHCGPPEDFKCKFTHHVNYSSAVLAVNRHLPDLESQIKLTKHEQELSKLRKQEIPTSFNALPEARTTPSTTTTTTVLTKEVLTLPKTKHSEQDRKCSPYQFECRSTGECIAIYNACDGIAQCADGSDEAPELECPEAVPLTTLPPTIAKASNTLHNSPYSNIETAGQINQASQNQENYRPPVVQQRVNSNPPIQTPAKPEADFLRPVADPRTSGYSYYEPQSLLPYQQYPAQQQTWIPHQSNQMPPQLPSYADKNSHIFNHKETGLQVSEVQERERETSGNQYADINSARDLPKVSNYYGEVFREPLPQPLAQYHEWNRNDNKFINPRIEEPRYNMEAPQYATPPDTSLQQHLLEMQEKYKGFGMPDIHGRPPLIPNVSVPPLEKTKQEQDKMAHELKHSKEHFEEKKVETKEIKIEKHPAHSNHDHDHDHEHDHNHSHESERISMAIELQDGIAETPSGAILSLTLGLIITCIMAILIGCRLRVVRRRMRRGGKSYAHDADYLVNGMYL